MAIEGCFFKHGVSCSGRVDVVSEDQHCFKHWFSFKKFVNNLFLQIVLDWKSKFGKIDWKLLRSDEFHKFLRFLIIVNIHFKQSFLEPIFLLLHQKLKITFPLCKSPYVIRVLKEILVQSPHLVRSLVHSKHDNCSFFRRSKVAHPNLGKVVSKESIH